MITKARVGLCAAVAAAVVVVLAPPLVQLYLSLLREVLHVGCSLGDDQLGDQYPAEWTCADGIGYVLPALAYAAAVGVLAFSAALAVALRPAGQHSDQGRGVLRAALWGQVLALAVLVLPAALAGVPALGPAPLVSLTAPVLAVGTAAVVQLACWRRAVAVWVAPLLWVLAALVVLISVPLLFNAAPAAQVGICALAVLAALSTQQRWQPWQPRPWPPAAGARAER
ncbi:hypothetical protein [Kineococcus gypseus]|uniref:hypothetical protein n=1 Tax=Kineococcus gypseus TaxID=1637102 RepID=UPI003D7D983C